MIDKRFEPIKYKPIKSLTIPEPLIHTYERYLPSAFDESLSLLEKVNKVIEFLNLVRDLTNEIADQVNNVIEEQVNVINELLEDYNTLKDWLTGEGLKLQTVEVLNEWFEDGTLATIINEEVFNMKADKVDLDNLRETITNAMNQLREDVDNEIDDVVERLDGVSGLINTEPYNILQDVESEDDITDYLQGKINELGDTKPIYIPSGRYYISKLIELDEGTQIIGDGASTILHFLEQGQIFLGYRCRVDNVNVSADYNYNGTVFYLDSRKLDIAAPLGSQEKVMITMSRIYARKEFNPSTNSKFMHLYGSYEINQSVGGFYGLTVEDIEVDGFNIPLHCQILGGWIHANVFRNWQLRRFTVGVKLQGGRRLPSESDNRIRRNKFHTFLFQPSQDVDAVFIEQSHDFPNDWQGIDIWDITRWSKYTRVGNVHFNSLVADDYQNSFTRYGVNLFSGGVYPIATHINPSSGGARFTMYYYETQTRYATLMFQDDSVRIRCSPEFVNNLIFHRDPQGQYYVEVTSGTAFGTFYYMSMRNVGNLPWHKIENPAVISSLNLRQISKELILQDGRFAKRTTLLNGHTGEIVFNESGNSVTISGRIQTNGATSDTVSLIAPPALSVGSGSSVPIWGEPNVNVRISEGGYLLVPANSGLVRFSGSYVRDV